jgi:predicted transcriptional regulator YdeE
VEIIKLEKFNIIGIEVRTTNNNGQGVIDIGGLWQKFVNTEYEGDYTQPYTTLIGCKVKHLEDIPVDMRGMTFNYGAYRKFIAKGSIPTCVGNAWNEIWNTNINRAYTQDFEVYSEKAHNPNNAEIDIYVAIKD